MAHGYQGVFTKPAFTSHCIMYFYHATNCFGNVRTTALTLFYTGSHFTLTGDKRNVLITFLNVFHLLTFITFKNFFSPTSLHLQCKGWAAHHAVLPFAHLTCNKIKCDKWLL